MFAFTNIYTHRHLIIELTKREFTDRYAGQFLGLFWMIAHPLFLMGIYVIVFGYIFRVRFGETIELPYNYSIYLISGLVSWLAFAESLQKGPTLITSSPAFVKQVVFPLEVLPIKSVLSCQVSQIVTIFIFMGIVLSKYGFFLWTYSLLPILIIIQTFAMLGMQYILATIGVFIKDLKDIVQVFCTANFFLMPMLYVPSALPAFAKPVIFANPFSHMIWCYQDVFYFGKIEHPWSWIIFTVLGLGIFFAGHRLFQHLRRFFANVI